MYAKAAANSARAVKNVIIILKEPPEAPAEARIRLEAVNSAERAGFCVAVVERSFAGAARFWR